MPQIVRLPPSSYERFRRIRLRSLLDAPDAFGSTHAETITRPDSAWQGQLADLATFVAVQDEADVGVVRGGLHEDERHAAVLLSMWVAPEARGRGVGEALIRAVVDWAREQGCARLYLEVGDHNTTAIGLYARMGFQPTGRTGSLPPPRADITEHERVLLLSSQDPR